MCWDLQKSPPSGPREGAAQLIKSSTDTKVKCGDILPPLRDELSVAQPGRGGARGSLTVFVKREISLLTDPTKARSTRRDGDEENS